MPIFSGGGSSVSSANIVDDTIVDADINVAAAINAAKIAGLIGNPGTVFSAESTSGATHSLTTVAGQRVVVFGFMNVSGASTGVTITSTLKYNGVTKDTRSQGLLTSSEIGAFALMYTEIPGAATQNVTLNQAGGGGISNAVIVVIKIQTT